MALDTQTRNRFGLGVLATLAFAFGCQGAPHESRPIHLNPNMDWQQKFEAQERNDYFYDQRAMRKPVEGTVARGYLKDDIHLWEGRDYSGKLVDELPAQMEVDEELLARGEERYNIYCAPCHSRDGNGKGPVSVRGGGFAVKPPGFHTERLRAMPLGYFYDVIRNGRGTMLPYKAQVPVEDRWAIVAWIRALQLTGKNKGWDSEALANAGDGGDEKKTKEAQNG